MAEVRHALAGHRQIVLLDLIKPAAALHHQAAFAQHRDVLGRQVGAGPDALGNLRDHQRFARAQFAENLPAHRRANGEQHVIQWEFGWDGNGRWGISCGIHGEKVIL